MWYGWVVVIYLCWVLARAWDLKMLLALPGYRGGEWFFGVHFGPQSAERARLLRGYRRWMWAVSLAGELLALADVVYFGTAAHLIRVQLPLLLAIVAIRRLLLRGFALRARDLAAPPADARVAFSLKPRRLAEYTNRTFEALNGAAALGALAAIVASGRQSQFLVALVLVYLQAGLLLLKIRWLRSPVALPADRSDEALRLVEDAFRVRLRNADAQRAVMTFLLAVVAVKAAFWDAWMARTQSIALILLPLLMAAGLTSLAVQARRGRALRERAKALQMPIARRRLLDPENLRLAGLVYCNAENPAVVVDGGPLRFAVNVVNRNTYLYAGYWIGLAALMAKLAGGL
jgi:hypothetical protein